MRARTALMIVAALLPAASGAPAIASGTGSNPRMALADVSYVAAKPVTEPAQIDAWLRRMVGRYQADGIAVIAEPTHVGGAMDCIGVGKGPGIQCILNITWIDVFGGFPNMYALPGGDSFLDPAMMLVGMNPASSGLTFLLVDNKGLPEGGSGVIAGNVATFRTPCVNAIKLFQAMSPTAMYNGRRPSTCTRITRFEARPPDSRMVFLYMDIEINDVLAAQFQIGLRRALTGRSGAD